jgi:acetylornithine deacetylase/succinyl-diaminopimelate desuccinylase-like protein
LDLRSDTPAGLEFLVHRVQSLIKSAIQKVGSQVKVSGELIRNRPAGGIPVDHALVKLACNAYLNHGIRPKMIIGTTDANIPLSRGLPAICLGLTTGGGSHTLNEYLDIAPLSLGLEIVAEIILSVS